MAPEVETRRDAVVQVSFGVLHSVLGFPPDAEVVDVVSAADRGIAGLLVEHPGFPERPISDRAQVAEVVVEEVFGEVRVTSLEVTDETFEFLFDSVRLRRLAKVEQRAARMEDRLREIEQELQEESIPSRDLLEDILRDLADQISGEHLGRWGGDYYYYPAIEERTVRTLKRVVELIEEREALEALE